MAREAGSTTAGFHRMFEYRVPPIDETRRKHTVGQMSRLQGKLRHNYGQAGLIYAKFLGTHTPEIEKHLALIDEEIPVQVSMTSDERLWVTTIEVLLLGAMYANRLKLTDIDLKALKAFLIEVFYNNRAQITTTNTDVSEGSNALLVLGEFLAAHRARNTLVTDRIPLTAGRVYPGTIAVVSDAQRLDQIIVQVGRDNNVLRVARDPLKEWLHLHGHSSSTWLKTMEEKYGAISTKVILGGGTLHATSQQQRVVQIDLNNPALASFNNPEEKE